jgi:hypothetical protein
VLAAPRRLWPRRARGPPPVGLPTRRPISGSVQATIPRLSGSSNRHRERMTPNQQQGQAGPFPCVLGEGGA